MCSRGVDARSAPAHGEPTEDRTGGQDRCGQNTTGPEKEKGRFQMEPAFRDKAPGDDLLLHGLSHTTIGAAAFHFRVRDGIGWFHSAMVARERVEGRRLQYPGILGRAGLS